MTSTEKTPRHALKWFAPRDRFSAGRMIEAVSPRIAGDRRTGGGNPERRQPQNRCPMAADEIGPPPGEDPMQRLSTASPHLVACDRARRLGGIVMPLLLAIPVLCASAGGAQCQIAPPDQADREW